MIGRRSEVLVLDAARRGEAVDRASLAARTELTPQAVSNVLTRLTDAGLVETAGTRSYVLVFDKGVLTRRVIKVGMVGDTYTQVLSGLSDGQSVVLAGGVRLMRSVGLLS